MSKALAPAAVVASAALSDDVLDGLVDGIAENLGLTDATVAHSFAVELAPLDRCGECDHMQNQHADGGCNVAGCDCDGFEAAEVENVEEDSATVGDAVEYAADAGRELEVVGFQIAAGNLTDRLDAAVHALVADQDAARPMVRLRLEELALRQFQVTPPPDGGIVGSLEWEAILAPEGRLTDDFRAFAPGAIKWRELPLTLMAMLETQPGHDGAKVCGRIDVIWRDESTGLIRAAGVFDDSEFGRDVARMVDEKVLRGNSVDLAIHDYEVGPVSQWFDPDGNWDPKPAASQDEPTLEEILFEPPSDEPVVYVVTDAVIGMSTVCPFPAFADAKIEVARSLAAAGSPAVWTVNQDGGFRVTRQRPQAPTDDRLALTAAAVNRTGVATRLEQHALTAAGYTLSRSGDRQALTASAPAQSLTAGAATAERPAQDVGTGGQLADAFDAGVTEAVAAATSALTAAVTPPLEPPAAWFANPELGELTPIVVTDEGRVYGHAAGWSSCHTGFPDVCVTPPHSNTDYRFFHLKSVEADDGSLIDCGTITLEAPHANQSLGLVDATAHYDNTGVAAADVVVGEDEHGIWVAGAVRPHLTPEMIRELRGAVLSGDWRNYEGNLELIGLLAVNVPGFPVPKVRARVAAGVPQSLVAAGVVTDTVPEPPGIADAAAQLAALADDDVASELAELARDEG